ncbi:MAG: hypothetical protein U0797_20590 [Gemmataceae bacterium]
MESLAIAGVVLGCTFGGTVLGMVVRGLLPEPHLGNDSKDSVKMAMGLVATMTALVLGLLVASAKGVFDSHRTGVQQLATNVVVLDRILAQFGPDSAPARAALRDAVVTLLDHLWSEAGYDASRLDAVQLTAQGGALYASVRDLPAPDDSRKALKNQAHQAVTDLTRTRWSLGQRSDSSIPRPFLIVLAFWLTALFLSFGLFAPRNMTVLLAFLIASLSVAGALLLIAEMDQPFRGLIQVSATPLRDALLKLGQ